MNIVIVGNGNVASHLAKVLYKKGHRILQIIGRQIQSALVLAQAVDAEAIDAAHQLNHQAELIIIAVPDDVLAKQYSIPFSGSIPVVHTSGSVSLNALKQHEKSGVFYPLQTFSKNRKTNFSEIPICIESECDTLKSMLFELGKSISNTVVLINSENRKQLHLSAVFACNFVNFLYISSKDLLEEQGLSFDLLKPLISETAQKALEVSPEKAQTGPAVRNDQSIIKSHLEMLDDHQELQQLYQLLTQMIFEKQAKYEEL